MYLEYGIEKTLRSLDGVFAFCLYDTIKDSYYFARDPDWSKTTLLFY